MNFSTWIRLGSLAVVVVVILVLQQSMRRKAREAASREALLSEQTMAATAAGPVEKVPVYFQLGHVPTADELIRVLQDKGYAGIAARVRSSLIPCLRLAATPAGARSASRLGGRPDLPAGVNWPAVGGKPMAFLAQFSLGELPADATCEPLPRRGVLFFFVAADPAVAGLSPGDRDSWRVLYSQAAPPATVAAWPADLPESARYKERAVRLVPAQAVPDTDELVPPENDFTARQEEEVFTILGQYTGRLSPRHQLLGHPARIQGDMAILCQLASHGLDVAKSIPQTAEAEKIAAGAADWRLLLQLDSDEAVGMQWGDCGRLFFWIPTPAAEKADFSAVWMIMQSY